MQEALKQFVKKIKATAEMSSSMSAYSQRAFDRVIGELNPNDTKVTVLTLTKDEITSPLLKESIEQSLFDDILGTSSKLVVKCSDRDLAFNKEEAMRLVDNHEVLTKAGGAMFFEESISSANCVTGDEIVDENENEGLASADSEQSNVSREYKEIIKHVLVSFQEMMGVNEKLADLAKNIKEISDENNLTPYEQYLLCHRVVSNLPYYTTENASYDSSQSYIETVQKNSGCCVGKAQYLRALLSMIGIKSCVISVNSKNEEAAYRRTEGKPSLQSESILTNHAINLICLEDQKYGISGVFAGDAVARGSYDFITLENNLTVLFNYGGLYRGKNQICTFLKGLPTDEQAPDDLGRFERQLQIFGRNLNPENKNCAIIALESLKKTKKAVVSLDVLEEVGEKLTSIYKQNFDRELECVSEEDVKLLKNNPEKFWRGVKEIQVEAFKGCESLESVVIPDSIINIGIFAFRDCKNLKYAFLPKDVTKISAGMFKNCRSLKSIVIPDSVTDIESGAFNGCTSLEISSFPENVTKIEVFAFCGCVGIKSMVISENVTEVGGFAFCDCTGLKSVTISGSVKKLEEYVFSGCTNLESVTLHNGVEIIGTKAFSYCTSLKNMIIPQSVTEIGEFAFWGCTSLESIVIPYGVKSIGELAFAFTKFKQNNGEMTVEYEKGKFAKVKHRDFFAFANVKEGGELCEEDLEKMRMTIKEKVAKGEFVAVSESASATEHAGAKTNTTYVAVANAVTSSAGVSQDETTKKYSQFQSKNNHDK